MKEAIQTLLKTAINSLQRQNKLPTKLKFEIQVENTRDKMHGDFACNIALVLANSVQMKPRELAELILTALPTSSMIEEISIAGPGFINFKLAKNAFTAIIKTILIEKEKFGFTAVGQHKKINIEFISANPTGPLHVGHGRSAAYGAAVADLLSAIGYSVEREYYVNDAGRQMNILAVSIWLRYLELHGLIDKTFYKFPKNAYKGQYVKNMAATLKDQYADALVRDFTAIYEHVPEDEVSDDTENPLRGDKEAHIDALIANAKKLLNKEYNKIFAIGLDTILSDIKEDTAEFGIQFQNWISEKSLETSNAIQHAIEILRSKNYLYERDKAIWFKSSEFGDEKDRVVIRENGQTTYFASDLAYLLNKIERGFDTIIYIFGADHHGYVPRLRAAAKALGIDDSKLMIPLVQFAVLYRGSERVQMSTRSGEFVTLRDLREEVGKDACRYFYVMRKVEQHMDFDLELAKSNNKNNPVYYIQYAHARICRVLHRLKEYAFIFNEEQGLAHLDLLSHPFEKDIIGLLNRYQEIIIKAAEQLEPHLLANYLRDLATALHSYYDASGEKILVDNSKLRDARLCLISAVKQVLANGLFLLNISAPEKM